MMNKKVFRIVSVFIFTLVFMFAVSGPACFAADYPAKPITMIDPWPPGGGVDIVGRIVASVGAEILGQPLIMKYVSGAAGVRGAGEIVTAKPDGYTIILVAFGAIVNQAVADPKSTAYKKDDFVFLSQISASPCVLVANPKAPFKDLKGMVSYVKANPGKIVYSSSGRFGFVHSAFARLIGATGLEGKMIHLPAKGGAGAAKECLGGHTMVTGGTPGVTAPHIRAGSLIPLAVCDTQRWPDLPDVPTLKEALGMDITPTTLWVAPAVPKETPADRVAFLREGFKKILATPSVKKLATRTGDRIVYLSGQEMQEKWNTEWAEANKLLKILLEK
jgi:tripartite-type tricarboxylate transporter receptor subunit TctC